MAAGWWQAWAVAGALLVAALASGAAGALMRRLGGWVARRCLETNRLAIVGLGPLLVASPPGASTRFRFSHIEPGSLRGKVAVITGASEGGIGFFAALHLARAGAHVVIGGRDLTRCRAAASKMRALGLGAHGAVAPAQVDTSSLASLAEFAAALLAAHARIDVLVLNAGIATVAENRTVLSADGIELVTATNFIGHFLLTDLLLPRLQDTARAHGDARVVMVSSAAHYRAKGRVFTDLAALNDPANFGGHYGLSKACMILHARELTRRLGPESRVFVNACHPGGVLSGIWKLQEPQWRAQLLRHPRLALVARPVLAAILWTRDALFWSTEDGALNLVYLAASPLVAAHGQEQRGMYFHPVALPVTPSLVATEGADDLWRFAKRVTDAHRK